MQNYGRESVNGDFPCAKLKNAKKIRQNFFFFCDLYWFHVKLAKFENDPWKIMDVRVLTGLVCPAARPPARSGYDNTPEPLRAAG